MERIQYTEKPTPTNEIQLSDELITLYHSIDSAFVIPEKNKNDLFSVTAPFEDTFIKGRIEQNKRKKYIDTLINELVEKSSPKVISPFTEIAKNFIHPDSVVLTGMMGREFKINDNQIYYNFFNRVTRLRSHDIQSDQLIERLIPFCLIDTLEEYFDYPNFDKKPRPLFEPTQSIKELQKKGEASCVAYSATAQNLLSLVGMESYLVYGMGDTVLKPNEVVGLHTYNIIRNTNGESFIFDTINSVIVLEEDGKKSKIPAIYPISDEQFTEAAVKQPRRGNTMNVVHSKFEVLDENYYTKEIYERSYRGSYK